ncbi:hypothetical protein UNDKW_5184 [Undibacterium sp. KW1]|uniref:hypothetical protein n=1 Tax=Undibacterium sp. KW1 TaxID=2058624 RepID=UPI001331C64C|nr:hypothetical protein [Undibacterium sp. KW1]BBB63457.1 hypothetical protein UNDKW_5184 [Undibacterium sp. KW1]
MSNALAGNNGQFNPAHFQKLKTVGRWALRIFLAILLIIVLLVAALAVINWKDEALNPEAQAFLHDQQYRVPDAQNGFYIMEAMNAPLGSDLLKTGIESIKAEQALYQKDKAAYESQHHPEHRGEYVKFSWNNNRCRKTIQNCVKLDLEKRAELTTQITNNLLLAQRYALMRKMGNYEEHLIPSFNAKLPAYINLSHAIDLLLTQASFDVADGKLDAGLQLLESNDSYLRLMLKNSSSLISKMVLQAAIRKQARTVSELLVLYPALLEQYAERITSLVRPMTEEEKSLERPYLYEAGVQVNFSQHLRASLALTKDKSDNPPWPLNLPGELTFQPNATSNMVARNWALIIAAAKNPSSDASNTKNRLISLNQELSGSGITYYLNHAYNPAGKMLMQIGVPDYAGTYIDRSRDTDAYLRMVSLQADILRKKIPDADIPAYLASAPAALRNPYDGSAMEWDEKAGQLKFTGHENANSNLDGGKLNIVVLR